MIPCLLVACLAMAPVKAAGESPLTAGAHVARIDGLRLSYRVSGHGPVCLVPTPGWGPSSDGYVATLKPLEGEFTMVYLDTRGSGRSERPARQRDYTWAMFAADLDGLRARLNSPKVWILGHSEAGVHAMQYALRYPSHVAGLLLVDTLAASDRVYSADVNARIALRKGEPWFADGLKALGGTPGTDAEMAEMMRRMLPFYFSDPAAASKLGSLLSTTTFSVAAKRGQSVRWPFDLLPRLHEIGVPTLIVVGADDFICSPPQAERIHMRIRNSKLLLVEKAGHFPWLEQPDAFFSGVRTFMALEGRCAPAQGIRPAF